MLTMPERQTYAARLRELRRQLEQYAGTLVKELPTMLGTAVRQEKLIAPITTSGLEHVSYVMYRINWAIYYLESPDFPAKMQPAIELGKIHEPTSSSHQAKNAVADQVQTVPIKKKVVNTAPPISPTVANPNPKPNPEPIAKPTEPDILDFGPFDPRNGSKP